MITIIHPHRHSRSGPEEKLDLEWIDGKTVKMYLNDARLSGLKTHCRMDVKNDDGYFERIKTSYVPRDGDLIRLRRTRSIA